MIKHYLMHKKGMPGLLAGAVLLLASCGGSKGIKVAVEKAGERTITETVSASGRIQPATEVKISSDVSGEIIELNVKEGDSVKKGDLLVKIYADIYQSNVNQMEAAYNQSKQNQLSAQARLNQLQAQFAGVLASYSRTKTLYDQGVVSQSEFDQAQSEYNSMRAQVNSAKEEAEGARYNVAAAAASMRESASTLARTTIYAPVNGTVSLLNVELGERVVGTAQMTGTEMMRISNLAVMEARVEVNENDIARVKLGDSADVEVDAFMGRTFKGVVTEISSSASNLATTENTGVNINEVTNFDVRIRILPKSYQDLMASQKWSTPSPFRPGLSTSVDIQTEKAENVLSIPIQSVALRDAEGTSLPEDTPDEQEEDSEGENGQGGPEPNQEDTSAGNRQAAGVQEVVFVYNKQEGTVKMRRVKTGVQDDRYIQILSGLNAGDEVVVAPYLAVSKTLRDGAKINVVDRSSLFEE